MACQPLLFDIWFPRYESLKILDLAFRKGETASTWGARVGGASHILRKSSDFKLFEKQHGVTQKSNKNNKSNTLAKYAIFGIWHIPTYFAVGQGQPRPNLRHFFWERGELHENWFQVIFGRF